MRPEFQAFNKIPRLFRECVVTEKIDGTNSLIHITDDGEVYAGSRTRWITPGKQTDNAGFAAWVEDWKNELREGLGPGSHYGEWWGPSIGRKYNIPTKRFSLFNTARWNKETIPACSSDAGIDVVPVLWTGTFSEAAIKDQIEALKTLGSVAAPGWMQPEGVVVYMTSSGTMYKVLCENDELPKGQTTRMERELAVKILI